MTRKPTTEGGARFWAVVPAAGVGSRMDAGLPKQYLPLGGQTVLDHALGPLLAEPRICGIVVALAPEDDRFATLEVAADDRVVTVLGGERRADSVANALALLAERARADDWVLVHDAARPCLHPDDLTALMALVEQDDCGGLLAAPVTDTLKRADNAGRVLDTVSRLGLWRAMTPQLFMLGALREALGRAADAGLQVTDESAAVEAAGRAPSLVVGRSDNVKVTLPEDLILAEAILRRQGRLR